METIYISGYLKNTDRGRHIAKELKEIAQNPLYNFQIKEIPDPYHSKNEWCRDYMPIKGVDGKYYLFKYQPSYLVGRKTYEETIPNQAELCDALKIPVTPVDIILDGGAIEILGTKGIITDRVISDNTSAWKNCAPELIQEIRKTLKLDELIVAPADPWDFTGHVDGMIRFVDESTVLVNEESDFNPKKIYSNEHDLWKYRRWQENLKMSSKNARLKQILLTCTMYKNKHAISAKGAYMNFLKLEKVIIMPTFEDDENDEKAKKTLKEVYQRPVETIQSVKLSEKGGVINCVTWNA